MVINLVSVLCFQVYFRGFPESMHLGEVSRVDVELVNCGQTPLNRLRLSATRPDLFTFTCSTHLQHSPEDRDVTFVEEIPLDGGRIGPGESQHVTMWLCATVGRHSNTAHALSHHSCVVDAQFLFGYEAEAKNLQNPLK